jgi:hypothetical protein
VCGWVRVGRPLPALSVLVFLSLWVTDRAAVGALVAAAVVCGWERGAWEGLGEGTDGVGMWGWRARVSLFPFGRGPWRGAVARGAGLFLGL